MSSFNYDSINQAAALYRIRMLPGEASEDDIINAVAMRLLNNVEDYRFFSLRRVLFSTDFLSNYRNLLYILYALELQISEIESKEISFFNDTNNWFKKLNKDIKILKDQIKENGLRLRNPNTKTKIKSVFSEREAREKYDLVDYKTGLSFKARDQVSFKNDSIQTKEIFREKLEVVNVELCSSISYMGDSLIISQSNPRDILSPNNVYKHIVGKESSPKEGRVTKEMPVSISLILSFNGKELVNNLYIETASMLPLILERNAVEYWTQDGWRSLENTSNMEEYNRWQIYFEEVYTDKIKIKFLQDKKIELAEFSNATELDQLIFGSGINENPIIDKKQYNIYDLSINTITPYYYGNSNLGIYRDSESLDFSKGYSADLNITYLVEKPDCLIERSLEVETYNYGNLTSQVIVPLPSQGALQEKEVLVFERRVAKLLFPVKANNSTYNLSVFLGTEQLQSGRDYTVEILDRNNRTTLDTVIKLQNAFRKTGNLVAEYETVESFSLKENPNFKYENKVLSFNIPRGRVRPRLVLRNLNKDNKSSIISSYRLSVEEEERTISEDFTYNNDIIER